MAVAELQIHDFRNLIAVNCTPLTAGFNFLYGLNGSGKTSVLEAIYYLCRGRSFRSATFSRIVRRETSKFQIIASLLDAQGLTIPVGIEREQQGEMTLRIAGKDAQSIVELASLSPVQLINSHCYNLLDAGPAFRRKFLDWGIFYSNPGFMRAWREYSQVLKQRNAALKQFRSKNELDIWTRELAAKALPLDQFRRDYVAEFIPILEATLAELLVISGLSISYQSGWDRDISYGDLLQAELGKDSQAGFTQFGPHRADLRITINKVSAKDILSRGQQKLFVCAMILAQGSLLQSSMNKKPLYLIDDLPAELDIVSRTKLITLLSKQETQIFVTAVEREALGNCLSAVPLKMFHVEHGNLTEVTEH